MCMQLIIVFNRETISIFYSLHNGEVNQVIYLYQHPTVMTLLGLLKAF